MMSNMDAIRIEKVTLNVGAGHDQKKLAAGVKLLGALTGKTPVKTRSKVRIAAWNIRLGLPIGAKVTLRKEEAYEFLKRAVYAKDNVLAMKNFDNNGNFSFGIPEYIEIKDAKYDPELGMMGLEISVTLERPGYRVKKRNLLRQKLPSRKVISKDEAIDYARKEFDLKFVEEMEEEE